MALKAQVKQQNTPGDLFEWAENKGQWDSSILFRTQQQALDLLLGKNYLAWYFYDAEKFHDFHPLQKPTSTKTTDTINIYGLRFLFEGARQNVTPLIREPKSHYLNFYTGNNPSHWAHRVRVSNHVGIEEVYPGIDFWLHCGSNQMKMEWEVNAHARLSDIQIKIAGATRIYTEYGDLFIETPLGTLREQKPYAYQYIQGKKIQVSLQFAVANNILTYTAGDDYNPEYPLIIDPEIVFLTYSGSTVDNFGCSATPGENGTMYAAGVSTGPYPSNPTGSYPVSAGAFQKFYGGGGIAQGEALGQFPCDITFSKYATDGKTLLYATYLGGQNNEIPHSMFVDNKGNLIVMGNTFSSDYPTTKNAFDTSHNGLHDLILTKFNSFGLLQASTYLGGSGNDAINYTYDTTNYFFADSYRGDVITDPNGYVLVSTVSQSVNFPVSAGCFQNNLKGNQDGVALKMSPGLDTLVWSTYLGGKNLDVLYSVDLDENNHLFLSGGTNSPDLPGTAGNFQPVYGGGQTDGFIAILNSNGTAVLDATYFGTNLYDQIFSLDIDREDRIYVVGQSLGNIEVTPGKYSNPGSHQFLACFTPDLKTKIWSTVFGSGRNAIDVTINAFMVNECNHIFVSTWGGRTSNHTNSSTRQLPVTSDAYQPVTDGADFYLMLLNKHASSLLYATFLGGDHPDNSGDHVDGGTSRFDPKGVVYQSMCASCPRGSASISDLNTTPGAYAEINLSPRCSNAALKFDFRITEASFSWEADTCSSTFTFFNKTNGAANFYWTFPDGDSSFEERPVKHLGPEYYGDTIRMIIEFGTVCADTAYGFVSLPDTLDHIIAPNVFTPNNDGKNDFFMIQGVNSQCNETEVYIYNRWGQLYFEDKLSYFRWDGKDSKGMDAPEGVYFYMLKNKNTRTGKAEEIHGTITLIR